MNESIPLAAPIEPAALAYKDRSTGLVVFGILTLLLGGLAVCRAAEQHAGVFPPQLLAFSAAKEQQARMLATNLNLTVSPEIWNYFKAAKQGDWPATTNAYARLRWRSSQYEGSMADPTVSTPVWQTIIEVQTAYEAFAAGRTKYPARLRRGHHPVHPGREHLFWRHGPGPRAGDGVMPVT